MDIEIFQNESLAKHTFYGVGGEADEFYKIKNLEAFLPIWKETIEKNIPKILLGKGSNLLLSDKGFRGRVFVLEFGLVDWNGGLVTVDAGKNWQQFVEETNRQGFGDLCNLSGIPGNFGGFIRGNAGAFGLETGDFVESVEFFDEKGALQKFSQEECKFSYRESIFKKNPDWCVVRATLRLSKSEVPATALRKTKELLTDRWKKYPPGRSGGSFFKNPKPGEIFAGKLLDEAGAKGDQIGHAQISDRHANFIVNLEGKATQKDILELARKWKNIVSKKHGIELEPEIFICDELGGKIDI